MATAIDFCRSHGYRRVHLWTFEGLAPARHLYEKHGFRLVEQKKGTQWGREVNEQRSNSSSDGGVISRKNAITKLTSFTVVRSRPGRRPG